MWNVDGVDVPPCKALGKNRIMKEAGFPSGGGGRDSGWIIKIASVNTVGTFLRGDFILMQITLAILSLGGAGPGMRALGLEPDPTRSFVLASTFGGCAARASPLVLCLSPELPS